MAGTVSNLASIFRSMIALIVLALVGTASWMGYETYHERARLTRELDEARAAVAALEKENERLELAMRLLKVDHRVAQIEVLGQKNDGARPQTTFQFVEVDGAGNPIGEKKVFTLEGDRVYVDALVIKYNDSLVETGDPLRSTSVCLFRRVFGEYLPPDQGFPLDSSGSRPAAYSSGAESSPLERDIWANFWQYANNPSKAREAGVRAVHGEAPSMKLVPGNKYRVELRASGGLSIVAEENAPKAAA